LKPALLVCFALASAFGLGCSIDKRSDAFACIKNADCNNGRTCVGGFCVVEGTGNGIDAPTGSNGQCPGNCSSCSTNAAGEKTCDINCNQTNCTNGTIDCPAGFACTVECAGNNDCRSGVSCVGSLSCSITCGNDQTCNSVTCGSGPCNVTCSGRDSCQNVNCGSACSCDVSCTGQQSCINLTCGHNDTCAGTNGCSSKLDAICNSCQP
jgi:hypothetical protein